MIIAEPDGIFFPGFSEIFPGNELRWFHWRFPFWFRFPVLFHWVWRTELMDPFSAAAWHLKWPLCDTGRSLPTERDFDKRLPLQLRESPAAPSDALPRKKISKKLGPTPWLSDSLAVTDLDGKEKKGELLDFYHSQNWKRMSDRCSKESNCKYHGVPLSKSETQNWLLYWELNHWIIKCHPAYFFPQNASNMKRLENKSLVLAASSNGEPKSTPLCLLIDDLLISFFFRSSARDRMESGRLQQVVDSAIANCCQSSRSWGPWRCLDCDLHEGSFYFLMWRSLGNIIANNSQAARLNCIGRSISLDFLWFRNAWTCLLR